MRMRVLVSAYSCEPHRGSEPEVGWQWVRQIAEYHNVWVITRANNKKVIDRELAINPIHNAEFHYLDLPNWLRFYKRGNRGIHTYYFLWQIGAYLRARQLHSQLDFDLAHHLTFAGWRVPSFIALLPVPFVWGPVGGGEDSPKSLRKELGFCGHFHEGIRDLSQLWVSVDPFVQLTMHKAQVILASTHQTKNAIPRRYQKKVTVMSQLGISSVELSRICSPEMNRETTALRVISVGRLVYWKGFSLAIKAFARFADDHPQAKLLIVGEGPDKKRLLKIAHQEGIETAVEFVGCLSRSETLHQIAASNVLLFPSLHDSGGMVILEAMALGKPVVCLNLGGPGEIVTQETGFRINPEDPRQTVSDLAQALCRLASDQDLRKKMGYAGRRKAEAVFSWEKKGQKMMEVYESALRGAELR